EQGRAMLLPDAVAVIVDDRVVVHPDTGGPVDLDPPRGGVHRRVVAVKDVVVHEVARAGEGKQPDPRPVVLRIDGVIAQGDVRDRITTLIDMNAIGGIGLNAGGAVGSWPGYIDPMGLIVPTTEIPIVDHIHVQDHNAATPGQLDPG